VAKDSELQAQCDAYESELSGLRSSLQDRESESMSRAKDHEEMSQTATRLTESLEEKCRTISAMDDEVASLRSQVAGLEAELRQGEEARREVESRSVCLSDELNSLRAVTER
jgi:chromosome segregation ATPase